MSEERPATSASAACAMAVGYGARQLAVAPDPDPESYPVPPSVIVTAIDAAGGTCIACRIDSDAAKIIAYALLAAAERVTVAEASFKQRKER